MSGTSTGWWGTLERWAGILFAIGGVLALIFAILEGAATLSDMDFGTTGFLLIGYAVAFIGLLGLYPDLSDQQRGLAATGAIAAVLGFIGFTGSVVLILGNNAGILPEPFPIWLNPVPLSILGMVIGYLAFGAASLRTHSHTQALGLLLLAPGLLFGVNVMVDLASGFDQWRFIFGLGQSLAIIGVGYLVHTGHQGPSRPDSRAD